MTAELDEAVYALLTPARGVIDRHTRDDRHQCRCCEEPWPCSEANTAIGALDLVLRVHAASRRQADPATSSPGTAPESARKSSHRRMVAAYDPAIGSSGVAAVSP